MCKWYLETAPQYKAFIKRVWLWRDWPDRWGPDTGIDLVCEAKDGKLWAVQAKAWRSDLTIAKAEVDACFVKGSVNKAKLKLTYPDYFFATTP